MIAQFDPLLPGDDGDINTELIRLLVYLNSPTIIEKTLALIGARGEPDVPDWSQLASRNAGYGRTVQALLDNHPPSREIGYAMMLRNLTGGWSLPQRRRYFEFLNAAAKGSGGASFPGFLRNIREEVLGHCNDEQRIALQDITGEDFNPVPDFEIKSIQGPGRTWTSAEARQHTNFRRADFENGRSLYFAANCGKCHRFAGLGGNVGPDLTSIRNKFDVDYVIEHVIDPDKVISDQYQSSVILTADGRTLTGLISEADGKVVIHTADVDAEPVTIDADEVELIQPSPVSQMPKGLIDALSGDELRDLLAYLMSGGDPNDRRVYGR
jgi:putative heme-binding domain-containing protein